jgi:hypothetical protein
MRLKLWAALAVLMLMFGASAEAQQVLVNDTITTAGADCSTSTACVVIPQEKLRNVPSIGVRLNVGTSGTFEAEFTMDDSVWEALEDDVNGVSQFTADGTMFFSNPGYRSIRFRASAINGVATVLVLQGAASLRSTASLAGAAQGDGAVQDGANSAIEATVFDFANSNPVAVTLRDVNGDPATAGGTSAADDADFTDGTTAGTPAMAVAESASPTTVTEGDLGVTAMTINRALKTALFDADGNEVDMVTLVSEMVAAASSLDSMNSALNEDCPHGNDITPCSAGPLSIGEAKDLDGAALPNVVTEGQSVRQAFTLSGISFSFLTNEDGTKTPLVDEDAAETAANSLVGIGTVRRDTAASSAGTSGDNATLNTDSLGRLWVRPGRPCDDEARIQNVAIDTAASGNVELVALNGSDVIYVCGYDIVADAAVAMQFIYGTGAACGTGETDLSGPMSLAANGGISRMVTGATQFKAPAGNALCIENSTTGGVRGSLQYVRTAAP